VPAFPVFYLSILCNSSLDLASKNKSFALPKRWCLLFKIEECIEEKSPCLSPYLFWAGGLNGPYCFGHENRNAVTLNVVGYRGLISNIFDMKLMIRMMKTCDFKKTAHFTKLLMKSCSCYKQNVKVVLSRGEVMLLNHVTYSLVLSED